MLDSLPKLYQLLTVVFCMCFPGVATVANGFFGAPPPSTVSICPVSQPSPIITVPPPGLAHITEPPPQLNPMLTRMPPPGKSCENLSYENFN